MISKMKHKGNTFVGIILFILILVSVYFIYNKNGNNQIKIYDKNDTQETINKVAKDIKNEVNSHIENNNEVYEELMNEMQGR